MKNMIFKLLFSSLLFLFASSVLAQDNNSDSISKEGITPRQSHVNKGFGKNTYEVKDDSIQDYKSDKDFAYMKYLDSLLRQSKHLTSDTFSTNNATITRRNNNSQPRSASTFNLFNLPVIKIILWILAACFIGFVLYKLFGANIFRRNRKYNSISPDQSEDENVSDVLVYEKLIIQAVANKNFRLAIRYFYLQTLQKLADAGVVRLSADKTNYQYVNELGNRSYKNDFAAVTSKYEYVWYGKFDISEEIFNKLSGDFKNFSNKL